MTMHFANVNAMRLAYRVQGAGPPLVLLMGYRLNSAAWPTQFIEALAKQFTVITLDNRGTGQSEKPLAGYALANMARDVFELLIQLEITSTYLFGYSMGGAIAQEFVRQFPERVKGLVLCATMCGGPQATYAKQSVVRVMRDLDGLSPDEAARRIWKVTYAPTYLANNRELAESQMRREIADPTPLHAADLQFQAFAEFDASSALADIRCPTMLLTGDIDELISPQNSKMMVKRIRNAELIVLSGRGHRVIWEATEECTSIISRFFLRIENSCAKEADLHVNDRNAPTLLEALWPALEMYAQWPLIAAETAIDSLSIARQSILATGSAPFGDGKPILVLPQDLGSYLNASMLTAWLKATGYRPVIAHHADLATAKRFSQLITNVTRHLRRKTILITGIAGLTPAIDGAKRHPERISDLVVLGSPGSIDVPSDVRLHYISSGWTPMLTMTTLPQLLRNIPIQLLDQ
ncbi:alpha/beta fold hydrolase [Bradyrhizobium jicamae]|uniref:alpha/beta fold hydrolase n=1 Tax=Bradyrhizobium jicamae TaxID=280332 RepID=UPI001BA5B309|nr:alpha/beta hydrolase [Bradyrhizobium jicamae]MBR0938479.1 alpha/beta hydrolase [Bradyrhizobium jicamae]